MSLERVGSSQLQKIKKDLRGKAVILVGNNIKFRQVIENEFPHLNVLLPHIKGHVGILCTNADLHSIREIFQSHLVRLIYTKTIPNNIFCMILRNSITQRQEHCVWVESAIMKGDICGNVLLPQTHFLPFRHSKKVQFWHLQAQLGCGVLTTVTQTLFTKKPFFSSLRS